MDPGHPSIIPIIHALLWKSFGLHLSLSHMLNGIMAIVSFYGLFKLDLHFKTKGWIGILTAINPIILSMFAGLNTHIFLFAFFTWYLVYYLKNNSWGMMITIAAMLLSHNQGMLIATVVIGSHLIFTKNIKSVGIQLMGIIPWIIWLIIHKNHSGWYLFPPEYSDFRGVASPKALFKNAIMIVWRLLDFGLFIVVILGLMQIWKEKGKKNFYLLFVAIGIIGATWLAVKYSLAHRYFIFAILLLSLPAAKLIRGLKTWKKAGIVLLIISGSFWYYPGKQLSDANLMYRHYYSIYNQIQSNPSIKQNTIYSTPPNESPSIITHLKESKTLLSLSRIDTVSNPLDVNFVMHGNVCGTLGKNWKEHIKDWKYITYYSGPAWVNLYYSPKIASKIPLKQFSQRKISKLEKWITGLKNRFK